MIKCVLCDDTHNLANKKLPINAQLNNILKKEPDEIYRGAHHREALKIIEAVETLNEDIVGFAQNSEMLIKSHYDYLRDEVDINAESAIEAINNYRRQYMSYIEEMEQSCMQSSAKIIEEKDEELTRGYEYVKKQCMKWRHASNQPRFKDENLKEITKEANKLKAILKHRKKKCSKRIFNSARLVYCAPEREIRPDVVGLIKMKKFSIFELKNFGDSVHCMLANEPGNCLRSLTLDGDRVIACSVRTSNIDYRDNNVFVSVYAIADGKLMAEKRFEFARSYQVARNESYIYLITLPEKVLRKLDKNLNVLKSVTIRYTVRSMSVVENCVYVVTKNEPVVNVFDENLVPLKSFGQVSSPNDAFFFNTDFRYYFYEDDLVAAFDCKSNSVVISDWRSGKVVCKFVYYVPRHEIVQNGLQINSDATFFMLNANKRAVEHYDFETNLINSYQVPASCGQLVSFCVGEDGDLVVFGERGVMFINDRERIEAPVEQDEVQNEENEASVNEHESPKSDSMALLKECINTD